MTRPHCTSPDACVAKGAGHCRVCWGKEAHKRTAADPVATAKRLAGVRKHLAVINTQPYSDERRAMLADTARRHSVLSRPEVIAKRDSPDARLKCSLARIGGGMTADKLEEYRALTNRKGIPTKDAKAALLADIPGTPEHSRRQIANRELAQRLRAERQRAEAY